MIFWAKTVSNNNKEFTRVMCLVDVVGDYVHAAGTWIKKDQAEPFKLIEWIPIEEWNEYVSGAQPLEESEWLKLPTAETS